jgi:hypothetical protein
MDPGTVAAEAAAGSGSKSGSSAVAGAARANGGAGGAQSGSGGGGRVAIIATNVTEFDVSRVEARGGLQAYRQGSPGTVFVGDPSRPLGDLRVDARGTNFTAQPTRLWMSSGRAANTTTLLPNRLTDPLARFRPRRPCRTGIESRHPPVGSRPDLHHRRQ